MPIVLDGTNGVGLPTWTTSTRPSSPAAGQMGFNSTTGYPEWWSSSTSSWVQVNQPVPYIEYLVVAGGGAGGSVGGGGAGAVGGNGSGGSTGGNGGAGSNWQSLGTFYAGGGGGGAYAFGGTGTEGTGGTGGGGTGGRNGLNATSGTANTGGGGGGNGYTSAGNFQGTSGAGGSGIVIFRYLGSQQGSGGTITSSNGYTYHTFTTSGTFTA